MHRTTRVTALRVERLGVGEDRHPAAVGEVSRLAGRGLEPQHRLGRRDDQRPADRGDRLRAQQVEVLGRRGRVGDGHVVLGAQLQEPLDAGRGVVRALALVAVGEQQREPAALPPLGLAGADELVDDRHRAVDEVAELRLPEHQRLGAGDRVAVLEADAGELRQQRVVDVERPLVVGQVAQRRALLAGLAVDQRRVPLHEGAAPGVLTGQPDRACRRAAASRRRGSRRSPSRCRPG